MNEKSKAAGRLRWKRNPAETGLRSVGAGPRGWTLHDGVKEYARVYANGGDWTKPQNGWYWVVPNMGNLVYFNCCGAPVSTPEEAKSAALEYVKAGLELGDKS